jgi:hypothetical protein
MMKTSNRIPKPGDTCLTVRQPWAQLIVVGVKRVENRSRATNYRGRVWIHSSLKLACRSWSHLFKISGPAIEPDEELTLKKDGTVLPAFADLALGAVIGSIEIYDCSEIDDVSPRADLGHFAGGPWCWMLSNPSRLNKPIFVKGALGLWKWR